MVKQRFIDRSDWQRVSERDYREFTVDTPDFQGEIGILQIKQVREPLWVKKYNPRPEQICIAAANYTWVCFLPRDVYYAVTQMIDNHGQTVEWYIDICHPYTRSSDGRLYYDDWYLDIVLYPDGAIDLLDEEELEAARAEGVISKEIYTKAYQVRDQLVEEIQAGRFPSPWIRNFIIPNNPPIEESRS